MLGDCSITERGEATVGGNHHLVPFLAAAKEPRGVVGDLFLLTNPSIDQLIRYSAGQLHRV